MVSPKVRKRMDALVDEYAGEGKIVGALVAANRWWRRTDEEKELLTDHEATEGIDVACARYRGFELKAWRGLSMIGWELTYCTIYRSDDGWELHCNFSEDDSPTAVHLTELKEVVDDYLENPGDYE